MGKNTIIAVDNAIYETHKVLKLLAPYFKNNIDYQVFAAQQIIYFYKKRWPKSIILHDVPYGRNQLIDVMIIEREDIVYIKTRAFPVKNIEITIDEIRKSISQSYNVEIMKIQNKKINEHLFFFDYLSEEVQNNIECWDEYSAYYPINLEPIISNNKTLFSYDDIPF